MIKCRNCGADMRYDINKQMLICDYCDSTQQVMNVHKTDITSEEQVMEAVVHTCPQCGAELFTTEDTAATFCSYCGSSVLLESRLVMVNKPDFIIPFRVSKEEAEKAYKKKLAGAVFAPSSMKKAEIETMRGIYMPYWEYYVKDDGALRFQTKHNEHREGDYLVSDIYEVHFINHIESDGLEYDASSKFPDDLSQSCAPFYFKESKLFNSGYMSGFYADLGDVDSKTYYDDVFSTVRTVAAEEIMDHSNLSSYGVSEADLKSKMKFSKVEPGLAMYPVWFSCARAKKGKYINYAAINGQTGKVSADLPIDKKKLILGMLIFAIPIFALLYFLFTPNTFITVGIIGVLSIIGYRIGAGQIANLARDDKGLKRSKNKPTSAEKSMMTSEKKKMFWRMIIGVAICAAVIVFDPVYDIFFYAAAIVAGVLCGWNFWRMFELHNRSIVHPLPQLGKRGGEGA